MRKTIQIILVILAITSCDNYKKQKEGLEIKNTDYSESLDRRFRGNDNNKRQGYGVLVLNNGEVEHAAGYGMANMENKQPITPETKFYSWLLYDHALKISLLKEWEAGNIDLEASISEYIPGLPEKFNDIKVINLLNITSGLGPVENRKFRHNVEKEEVMNFIKENVEVEETPGTNARWTGLRSEFFLLEEVIINATNSNIVDILNSLFKEFGMDNSFIQTDLSETPGELTWYKRRGSKSIPIQFDGWFTIGMGTTITNINDLAIFFKGIDTKSLISEKVYNMLYSTAIYNDGSEAIDENNQWAHYATGYYTPMGYKAVPVEGNPQNYVSIAYGDDDQTTKYFPESNKRIFMVSNLTDAQTFETVRSKVEPVLFPRD